MVDLLGSTLEDSLAEEDNRSFKRAAFLAILDEEEAADRCSSGLIRSLRAEVEERLPE